MLCLPLGFEGNDVLGIGNQKYGLYYLDADQGIGLEFKNFKPVCNLSKKLWNCWLGHPSDQVLIVLKNDIGFENIKDNEPCEICQMAKQTRERFPLSEHKSSVLGELFHLDLWVPL